MTIKTRRLRVVKHRKGQIHDEDVARWRLEVPEQAAVALAQQAGYGQTVLPLTSHPPLLSPEPARNALDYANLLPPDVRHAVFRHCEMMARHQRLLLEGQERLKYVQAQIREMKARLPPLPPPVPPGVQGGMDRHAKGPDITPHQVRSPSCWASCCGLAPLPPPPLPPPEAAAGGGRMAPVAVELPPPEYFAQAALATALAQSRRQTLEAQAEQEDYQEALSGGGARPSAGGASAASSSPGVRAFSGGGAASDGGGGGGAVLTTATMGAGGRRVAMLDTTGDGLPNTLVGAELPGQMDRRMRESSAGGGGGGAPLLGGRPPAAPLQGKAPGTPQSLLRPLGSYGAGAGGGGGGGSSAPKKVLLPPMRASQSGAAPPAAAGAAGAGHAPAGGGAAGAPAAAASYDLSRYQDPESLRKITEIQATQRGRLARKQVAGMRAPAASAAARGSPLPPPQQLGSAAPPPSAPATAAAASYDLSRYQDPDTLKKVTTIQAAQRGRAARKQVAGMRAAAPTQAQQQQQPVAAAGSGPGANPFELPPVLHSRAAAGPPLPPLSGKQKLSSQPLDVTPPQLKEEQVAARRLAAEAEAAAAAAAAAAAEAAAAAAELDEMAMLEASLAAGMVEAAPVVAAAAPAAPAAHSRPPPPPQGYDLSRYQDPEALRKITKIQAAQRGRTARKQVAGMRAAAPTRPPPPQAAAAPSSLPAAPPPPLAAAPATPAAASYDLSRYQDPDTLKKVTTIQAAQRGRAARKQVAGMKGR